MLFGAGRIENSGGGGGGVPKCSQSTHTARLGGVEATGVVSGSVSPHIVTTMACGALPSSAKTWARESAEQNTHRVHATVSRPPTWRGIASC